MGDLIGRGILGCYDDSGCVWGWDGYGGVLHVCSIEHLVFFGGLLVVLRS